MQIPSCAMPLPKLVDERSLASSGHGGMASPFLHLRASAVTNELVQCWINEEADLPPSVRTICVAPRLVMKRAAEPQTSDGIDFYLSKAILDSYTDHQKSPRLQVFAGRRSYRCPIVAELARLAIPYAETPSLFSSAFWDDFQWLLCGQLVHAQRTFSSNPIAGRGGLSSWQRRTAIEFLGKHRYGNVKLADLAGACRLSSSHFARAFKVSFGQPLHAWVLQQRVSRAKRLLLNTNEQLIDIAFRSGFPDQTTFNRTFSRLEGISPGRWKRVHKS